MAEEKQRYDMQAMREARPAYRPGPLNGKTSPLPQKSLADLLKPRAPADGPPLPDSWGIGWPQFITRGIDRLRTEGLKGPYKTIKEKGIAAEVKRELQLITGRRH